MNVNPLFAAIVEEGWAGGHGTAGGMKMVFDSLSYGDGSSLAITSATIGLLYGVIGGTIAMQPERDIFIMSFLTINKLKNF